VSKPGTLANTDTGRNGFNGGDPYNASPDAGVAVLNTNVCTAMSMLVWMVLDLIFFKKPSVIGAVQGIITGLVAITPAAGFVGGRGAIIIGACSGTIPWLSMNILDKQKWFLDFSNDVVGDFHTHLVGGIVGGFLTGLFATSEGDAAFALAPTGGAIDGNGRQVWVQIVGFLFIIGWNVVWTSLICLFVSLPIRVEVRRSHLNRLDTYPKYHCVIRRNSCCWVTTRFTGNSHTRSSTKERMNLMRIMVNRIRD